MRERKRLLLMFWLENRYMAMGCYLKDEDRWKEIVICCVRYFIEWLGRGRLDIWKFGKIFYRGFYLGIF